MKKFFFLICLLSFVFCLKSQTNLVPNPSFEQRSNCPGGSSQLYLADNWKNCGGTPDYYNSCCTFPNAAGVPFNFYGYQLAQDSNAYSGIGMWFQSNAREVMGIKLFQPMVIGQTYYVSFFASLNLDTTYAANCSFSNLGVKFLNALPDSLSVGSLVQNTAHVYSSSIISDTANWTNISGSFIADSAYQYMAVGNFFDSLNINFTKFFTTSTGINTAYYYLDNFYVGTSPVGISSIENTPYQIFPNPAKDFIIIKAKNAPDLKVLLCDMNMKKIELNEVQDNVNSLRLDLSGLVNGIYFLKIISKNFTHVEKIIINH